MLISNLFDDITGQYQIQSSNQSVIFGMFDMNILYISNNFNVFVQICEIYFCNSFAKYMKEINKLVFTINILNAII